MAACSLALLAIVIAVFLSDINPKQLYKQYTKPRRTTTGATDFFGMKGKKVGNGSGKKPNKKIKEDRDKYSKPLDYVEPVFEDENPYALQNGEKLPSLEEMYMPECSVLLGDDETGAETVKALGYLDVLVESRAIPHVIKLGSFLGECKPKDLMLHYSLAIAYGTAMLNTESGDSFAKVSFGFG